MALDANNEIINGNGGIVVKATAVSGGYFITNSIKITDKNEAGKIPDYACVDKALCYCTSDNKFYQYSEITKEWEPTLNPLTDEEIDDLWDNPTGDTVVDSPSTGGLPSFTLTNGFVPVWNGLTFEDGIELDKIGEGEAVADILVDQEYDQTSTNPQSGTAVAEAVAEAIKNLSNKLDEKLMTCRYFSVPAGKYYPLKRNGTYMIYNSKDDSGKEHTISLVRRSDGTWTTVCTGAKQLSLSTPVVAVNGRYTYQLCGIANTGENYLGIPTTDGFRQATTNYAYVTSTGTMYVCESVQGKPLSIQDTQAKCIGPTGEAYKG
jgi:hypothetical protein